MSEHVWLQHVGVAGENGHGGKALLPAGAAEAWQAMGWEPCDPPEEDNPVVAENLAAQRVAAAEQAESSKKSSRRGGPENKEG